MRLSLLLALVLGSAGCTSVIPTTVSRQASFAPYAQTKIGGASARDFLQYHYAMLVLASKVQVTRSTENPAGWNWAGDGLTSIGSAIPVDRRGYFLTAAHCLGAGTGPMYLVFLDRKGLRSEAAYVVWRGDGKNPEADLAVLRTAGTVDYIYRWAQKIDKDEVVLGVGVDYTLTPGKRVSAFDFGYFGGKILGINKTSGDGRYVLRVAHSAPAHAGDSGGPLVDLQGNLVAINLQGPDSSQAVTRMQMSVSDFRGFSYRPDPNWLQKVMDLDYAEHPRGPGLNLFP